MLREAQNNSHCSFSPAERLGGNTDRSRTGCKLIRSYTEHSCGHFCTQTLPMSSVNAAASRLARKCAFFIPSSRGGVEMQTRSEEAFGSADPKSVEWRCGLSRHIAGVAPGPRESISHPPGASDPPADGLQGALSRGQNNLAVSILDHDRCGLLTLTTGVPTSSQGEIA